VPGYIYLIRASGSDFYKIGVSGNPKKRLERLQIGCPHGLELIAELLVDSPELKEYELHKRWNRHLVRGEWFNFHPAIIPDVLACFDAVPFGSERVAMQLAQKYIGDYKARLLLEAEETGTEYATRALEAFDCALSQSGVSGPEYAAMLRSFAAKLEGKAQARADIRKTI